MMMMMMMTWPIIHHLLWWFGKMATFWGQWWIWKSIGRGLSPVGFMSLNSRVVMARFTNLLHFTTYSLIIIHNPQKRKQKKYFNDERTCTSYWKKEALMLLLKPTIKKKTWSNHGNFAPDRAPPKTWLSWLSSRLACMAWMAANLFS